MARSGWSWKWTGILGNQARNLIPSICVAEEEEVDCVEMTKPLHYFFQLLLLVGVESKVVQENGLKVPSGSDGRRPRSQL